jgi:hypothetical protein
LARKDENTLDVTPKIPLCQYQQRVSFCNSWLFNDVRIHQAGQLEHVDLLLAVEYCF